MKETCREVTLLKPNLINATNNRHRVSTIYAALNLSKHERKLFYTHMGHSEDMNKDVYQTPLAIMGITKLGKQLMQINNGKVHMSTIIITIIITITITIIGLPA